MEHSATPRLILNNMSKHFGTVKAVDDVSLTFMPGEVRGLIGENGSGKSTLSAMICGSYKPTAGTMEFDGAPYHPLSVIDARNKGIAILLQERGTIDGMTVAENIFIGFESRFRGAFGISREKMKKAAQEMLHEIGADHIHPGDLVDAYKFEDRKLVEVARALYTRPEVLIVDETTSALSLSGREAIYRIIRRFKEEGKVVIFIGHDLVEIIAVCDTATVLKDGKFVATLSGEDMNAAKMRSLMIGRENLGHYYREDFVPTYNEERVVLRAEHLTYGKTVRDVSLELHEREILGICGLSDSGMHDLAKALFGALDTESGTVSVPGVTDAVRNPVQAVGAKIAYLPKDRDTESLFLQASIRDNISITCFDQEKLGAELSGGNKQTVVVAKWLANRADILIMDCPTRGIDVGVKASIYDLIRRLKAEGKSIVMLSEEMAEVIGMADRIIIIKDGAVSGEFMRSPELTEQMIVEKII